MSGRPGDPGGRRTGLLVGVDGLDAGPFVQLGRKGEQEAAGGEVGGGAGGVDGLDGRPGVPGMQQLGGSQRGNGVEGLDRPIDRLPIRADRRQAEAKATRTFQA